MVFDSNFVAVLEHVLVFAWGSGGVSGDGLFGKGG